MQQTNFKVTAIGTLEPTTKAAAKRLGLTWRPASKFYGVVPVENIWMEAPLPSDERWLVAYRIVMQEDRPQVAEVRVFPNEPVRDTAGVWSAELLGSHVRSVPHGGLSTRMLR